jgi:hypothetical protein
MTERPPAELIAERLDQLENDFSVLEQEVNSLRNVTIAIGNQVADLGVTTPTHPMAEPVPPPEHPPGLMCGQWPWRHGDSYPSVAHSRAGNSAPYYESWMRRSPPATE